MHSGGLLEIAIIAAVALAMGLILQRLKQPAIVGYIAAGVLLGPHGLGLVAERGPIEILAELGVLMLLFIIGMELSLRGFKRALRIALPAAAAQIVLSVAVMLVIGHFFGRSIEVAIVMGFIVALSSTAVAIKLLDDIGELRTETGRVAVSVLIAQDLAVVPMLLAVNSMVGDEGINFVGYLKVVIAIILLVLMIVVLTRRERVGLPLAKTVEGNVELTAITALAYCFGAALVSGLFGLSPAYGAFLAGLWIGNSTARTSILSAALPIQSVLLMVFFLSIGLLIDLQFIWAHLGEVLVMLAVVTLFKTVMNVSVLRVLGVPWPRAWLAGIVIGQVGEFSFLLLAAATTIGLLAPIESRLALSVIALSLMLSPLWLLTARRMGGVVWRNVTTFRDLWQGLYGRETRAVVMATQSTARFTIQMGNQGYEAVQNMFGTTPTEPGKSPDTSSCSEDATFESDGDEADQGGSKPGLPKPPADGADGRR